MLTLQSVTDPCEYSNCYSDELFKYSTASMTWTKLDADGGVTGMPPRPRSGHKMATVGEDIYVFGGYGL